MHITGAKSTSPSLRPPDTPPAHALGGAGTSPQPSDYRGASFLPELIPRHPQPTAGVPPKAQAPRAPTQNQGSPAYQEQATEAAFNQVRKAGHNGVCKPVSLLEMEHRFSSPESLKQLHPPPGVQRSKVTLRPLLLSTQSLSPAQMSAPAESMTSRRAGWDFRFSLWLTSPSPGSGPPSSPEAETAAV